jgi:ABC-type proline/glycine betaine transport system permease subunit
VLGSLFVRVLIPLAAWLSGCLRANHFTAVLAVAGLLSLLAWFSGGLSLNDGSLSLAAALQGNGGGLMATLLWLFMASLLSIAVAVPGGLMHTTRWPWALCWLAL